MVKKIKLILSKFKKPKNIWFGFISLVIGIFGMILPKLTFAQSSDFSVWNPLTWIPEVIIVLANVTATIGAKILELEGSLIEMILKNSKFITPVVQTGWSISRDTANLFFIGVLIYIAFATILRLEKSNPTKMIFKVIVIAVLINFSLMIGVMIIDASQAMFRFFIYAPFGKESLMTENLMNALSMQKLWQGSAVTEAIKAGTGFEFGPAMLTAIARLLFTVVFTFIAVIIFGAIMLILFIRNIYLWSLLILAPIAWFCGIVPMKQISGNAGKWWDQFIKWATVAPVLGFFIFLALLTAMGRDSLKPDVTNLPSSLTAIAALPTGFQPITIFQFIPVIGFLIAGLVAAESFGVKVAGGAHSLIKKTGQRAQKGMQRGAQNAWSRSAPAGGVRKLGEGINDRLENWSASGRFGKIAATGLRAVGVGVLGKGIEKAGGTVDNQARDLEKKYKNMDPERLKKIKDGFNPLQKAIADKVLTSKDKAGHTDYVEAQKLYSRFGMQKDLVDMEKKNPQWTDKFQDAIKAFQAATDRLSKAKIELKNANESGDSTRIVKAQEASKNANTNYEGARGAYDKIINDKVASKDKDDIKKMNLELGRLFDGDKFKMNDGSSMAYLLGNLPADKVMEQVKKLSPERQAEMVKAIAETVAPGDGPFGKIRHLRNKGWAKALNGSPWAAQYKFTSSDLVEHVNDKVPVSEEFKKAEQDLNLVNQDFQEVKNVQNEIIGAAQKKMGETKDDAIKEGQRNVIKEAKAKIESAQEKVKQKEKPYKAIRHQGPASKNSRDYEMFGEEAGDIDVGSPEIKTQPVEDKKEGEDDSKGKVVK